MTGVGTSERLGNGLRVAVADAVGSLAECTMALYGLRRLTAAREVASVRLLEASEGFRRGLGAHESRLNAGLAAMRGLARAPVELASEIAETERLVASTAAALIAAVPAHRRFGAMQRLELERALLGVGTAVEELHARFELLQAALCPRHTVMSSEELLAGPWTAKPSFVGVRVTVVISGERHARLAGDPRILWRVLAAASLRALLDHGALHVEPMPSRSSPPLDATKIPCIVWAVSSGTALDVMEIAVSRREQRGAAAGTEFVLRAPSESAHRLLTAVASAFGIESFPGSFDDVRIVEVPAFRDSIPGDIGRAFVGRLST
ncbi:MAG: hypothetical protein EXR75_09390 [Myxococcales bacterium]|nr:hypothetical protein [Myxococcales bacterium]